MQATPHSHCTVQRIMQHHQKGLFAFTGVDEDARPVEQDGRLDKRKDGGVAAAIDENQLWKAGFSTCEGYWGGIKVSYVEWSHEVTVGEVPLVYVVARCFYHGISSVWCTPERTEGKEHQDYAHGQGLDPSKSSGLGLIFFSMKPLLLPGANVRTQKQAHGCYDDAEGRHKPGKAIAVRWIVEVGCDTLRR